MAGPQSYVITRSNNTTEKEGLAYLLEQDSDFILLDTESRKFLMDMFDINHTFSRAFDLVYIKNSGSSTVITVDDKDSIIFVELKTTKNIFQTTLAVFSLERPRMNLIWLKNWVININFASSLYIKTASLIIF